MGAGLIADVLEKARMENTQEILAEFFPLPMSPPDECFYSSVICQMMGYKEIFLCLSNGDRAFWIRYLLSTRRETKASFMIAMFEHDYSSGFRTSYGTFSMDPHGKTKIGGNTIDIGNTYSLNWSNGETETSAITGITRLLDIRSQYVLLSPNALFNGQIRYLNESYTIKDYRGMVGYISQPDYLSHWAWVHMFNAENENTWLDLLISDRKLLGRNISLFSGRVNGMLLCSKVPATFSGTADISGIEGIVRVAGEKFIIHSHSDRKKILKVKYDAYCYNSELASTSLEHGGKIYPSRISFLEHGTVENLDGFVEVASTEKKTEETCHK